MTSKIDEAMDMSLDEYINSFKQMKNEPSGSNYRPEESKFKEGRRGEQEKEDDDDEFDPLIDELNLQCQEDDYVSLAIGNESKKEGDQTMDESEIETIDLRNKLDSRFPKSSQQWRLVQPNIMNVRPAGMPPLVPSDAPQNGLSSNGNGQRNRWRNYNNRNRRYQNMHTNWQNKGRNYNNNNNASGRIQRFNNYAHPNLNSKNIKIVLEQLKQRNPMILYSTAGTPDLTIETTSNNVQNSKGFPKFEAPTIIKSDSKLSVGNAVETVDAAAQFKGSSETIKSLLGLNEIGIRNDTLPALAGRLLDFLNDAKPTMHKPIYDMKIQKEIHEIQKKPLLYKCPGGEVVSSDGSGIPDCRIQPKASGISLNNRFA